MVYVRARTLRLRGFEQKLAYLLYTVGAGSCTRTLGLRGFEPFFEPWRSEARIWGLPAFQREPGSRIVCSYSYSRAYAGLFFVELAT